MIQDVLIVAGAARLFRTVCWASVGTTRAARRLALISILVEANVAVTVVETERKEGLWSV